MIGLDLRTAVLVSRPFVWLLGPLVFLAGLMSSNAVFSFNAVLMLFLLSFPFCFLLYGINDVYDYYSDILNPRKGGSEGIVLSRKYHGSVLFFSGIIALIFFILSFFSNFGVFLSAVILVFFAVVYSAPPLRFKAFPPLDSVSNGFIYALAPFALGFCFGASFLSIPLNAFLFSLVVVGIHAFSTIMDMSVDRMIGDNTFAVVFGARFSAFFALLCLLPVLFFGSVLSITGGFVILIFLILCALCFIAVALFPYERLCRLSVLFLGAVFVILALVWIVIVSAL